VVEHVAEVGVRQGGDGYAGSGLGGGVPGGGFAEFGGFAEVEREVGAGAFGVMSLDWYLVGISALLLLLLLLL